MSNSTGAKESSASVGRGGVRWWQALGAGAAFGVLLAGAFPPIGLWWLVFGAVVPLAWVGWRAGWAGGLTPGRAGGLAALGTVPVWLFEERWILDISAAGYVPLALVLCVYPGLFVWAVARIARAGGRLGRLPMGLVVPVVWVGVEFLRGRIVMHGYPWYLIAHPLIDAPLLASPAAVGGVMLVGLLVSAWAGVAFDAVAGRRRAALVGAGVVVAAWVGTGLVGALAGTADSDAAVRIAVVQTNVPQSNKMGWSLDRRVADFQRFAELTELVAEADPDLVVWPETMYPGYVIDADSLARVKGQRDAIGSFATTVERFKTAFDELRGRVGAPMLIGASTFEDLAFEVEGERLTWQGARTWNSAVLIEGDRVEQYHKMFLTPFGEVMPYISAWPWLEQRLLAFGASGMRFDLDAGTDRTVLTTDAGLRVVTPICFEATIPQVCRGLVYEDGRRRADLIVNLTNDGWFGDSDMGRRRHLLTARWRTIELGTPMVRAANTGISCVIDRRGVVLDRLDPRVEGTLIAEVRPATGTTIYGRIGDSAGWISLGGTILLVAGSYGWTQRRGRADSDGSAAGHEDASSAMS